jgi:hypothetical protein
MAGVSGCAMTSFVPVGTVTTDIDVTVEPETHGYAHIRDVKTHPRGSFCVPEERNLLIYLDKQSFGQNS